MKMAMLSFSLLLLLYSVAIECKTIQFYPKYHYVYSYSVNVTTERQHLYTNGEQILFGLQFKFEVIPRNEQQYAIRIKGAKFLNTEESFGKIGELLHPFLVEKLSEHDASGSAYRLRFSEAGESLESQNIKKSLVSMIEVEYEKDESQYSDYQQGILGRCLTMYSVIDKQHSDANNSTRIELQRIRDLKECFQNEDMIETYSFNALRFRFNLAAKGSKHSHYSLLEENDKVFITSAHSEEHVRMTYDKMSTLTDKLISTQRLELIEQKVLENDQEVISYEKMLNGPEATIFGNFSDEKVPVDVENSVDTFNSLISSINEINERRLDQMDFLRTFSMIAENFAAANANDLKKIFNHDNITADHYERTRTFFAILSVTNSFEALQAAMQITKENVESTSISEPLKKYYKLEMSRLFSSQRIRFRYFTKEMGLYFVQFCNEGFVKSDPILRKTCYLSLSRIIDQNCEQLSNPYKSMKTCDYHVHNELFEKMVANAGFNFSDTDLLTKEAEELILAVQTLANLKSQIKATEMIDRILLNKNVNVDVRTHAAWTLTRVENFFPLKYQHILLDRKEHYEIRIAMFHNILLRSPSVAQPFINALIDDLMNKRFQENKNLLITVYGMLKNRAKASVDNSYCFGNEVAVSELYNEMNEAIMKYFGAIDQQYSSQFRYETSKLYLSRVPNNSSFIPRSIYLRNIDSFVEEAFVARSENGFGFRQETDAFSANDGVDKDAFDALSKVISRFRPVKKSSRELSRSEPMFEVLHLMDRYCTGFIYKRKGDEIDANEWSAFKGFSVRTDVQLHYRSITESGFPFISSYLQSRIIYNSLKADHKINFEGFNGVYAISATITVLPLSANVLKSGKEYEKYFRLHFPLQFKVDSFKFNDFSLKIELPSTQNKSFDVYYEKLASFSAQKLSGGFIDTVDDESEEEILGVKTTIKSPLDSPKPELNWRRILLEYDASQVMIRNDISYTIRSFLPKREKRRDFDIKLKYSNDREASNASMIVINGNDTICELEYKQSVDEVNYVKNYVIKQNMNIWNMFTLTVLNVKFSPKNLYQTNPRSVEDANISGKFYFTKNGDEDVKDEKNVAVLIDGTFSKKQDQLSVFRIASGLHRAKETLDSTLKDKVLESARKFNRLELNYNVIRDVNKEDNRMAQIHTYLSENMFKSFADRIQVDYTRRTDDQKKIQLAMDTYIQGSNLKKLSNVNTTTNQMTIGFKGIESILIPKLMPYTNFVDESNLNHWLFDNELHSCELDFKRIRTFDGQIENHRTTSNLTKHHLFAADCKTSKFAVLGNDTQIRVLFDHKFDILIKDTENSMIVNSKNISFGTNEHKHIGPIDFLVTEQYYTLTFPFGGHISVFKEKIAIRLPLTFKGKLCGVCGDFDGDWSNDLRSPNGAKVTADEIYDTWTCEL